MAGPDLRPGSHGQTDAGVDKQQHSTLEPLSLCLPPVLTYFRGSVRKMDQTGHCPHSES